MDIATGLVAGLLLGWFGRVEWQRFQRWWNRPTCEICGGEPYSMVTRIAVSRSTGELTQCGSVVLCEACDRENDEAMQRERDAEECE